MRIHADPDPKHCKNLKRFSAVSEAAINGFYLIPRATGHLKDLPVVVMCDGASKPLLACRVPYLQLHSTPLYVYNLKSKMCFDHVINL
jgi:hypothetical protein